MILAEVRAIFNLIRTWLDKSILYVTPEMFGAVENSETHWVGNATRALERAFSTGKIVQLKRGCTYDVGTKVYDLSSSAKLCIEGNGATLRGGTILLNLNATWTRNAEGIPNTRYADKVQLSNLKWDKNHQTTAALVTGSHVQFDNVTAMRYKNFLCIPNELYTDRVNFNRCDTWLDPEDYDGARLIVGASAPYEYTECKCSGDDWTFRDCSYQPPNSGVPSLTLSNGRRTVHFINCINPAINYWGKSAYASPPQVKFTCCHFEYSHSPVTSIAPDAALKCITTYDSCFFENITHLTDPKAIFIGNNNYVATMIDEFYPDIARAGVTPEILNIFQGVFFSNAAVNMQKTWRTKFKVPDELPNLIRSVSLVAPEKLQDHKITGTYTYGFCLSDSPLTFDVSNKMGTNEVVFDDQIARWNLRIEFEDEYRYYLHCFRQKDGTTVIEHCVVLIDDHTLKESPNQFIEDGEGFINAIFPWLPYTEAGFAISSLAVGS